MAKEKVEFPAFRKSVTKKGTKPNVPQEKLISIKNIETEEIQRLRFSLAEAKVKTGQWKFCPKRR